MSSSSIIIYEYLISEVMDNILRDIVDDSIFHPSKLQMLKTNELYFDFKARVISILRCTCTNNLQF